MILFCLIYDAQLLLCIVLASTDTGMWQAVPIHNSLVVVYETANATHTFVKLLCGVFSYW